MIGLYVVCKVTMEKANAGMWLGACMSYAIMPDYADRFGLCLIQRISKLILPTLISERASQVRGTISADHTSVWRSLSHD